MPSTETLLNFIPRGNQKEDVEMPNKCQVCGRFIAEADGWNIESVECCEEHGFIKICGPCMELFEDGCPPKIAGQTCIKEWVRAFKKNLTSDHYPQYACPRCDYQSHSFTAAANHMIAKNHLYQGIGTYPIFIQGTETDYRKIDSIRKQIKRT